MNLDHIERCFDKSSKEIIKSLGVIQGLLKNETAKNINKSKNKKKKVLDVDRNREIEDTYFEERIVYEKTPPKKKTRKKKNNKVSYSTFVVDTSSSSEDSD